MAMTLNASFATRRDAEMAVERLVQEFNIERTDVFITTDGAENSAGLAAEAGSDAEAGSPSPETRDDAALNGKISVSVDIQDDALAGDVKAAFTEFDAQALSDG